MMLSEIRRLVRAGSGRTDDITLEQAAEETVGESVSPALRDSA